MSLFELATREKMRFPYRGLISTEDLWELPLTGLDCVFKTLNAAYKAQQEESLLTVKDVASSHLEAQIQIVKHIVGVKQAEAATAALARENRAKREKVMEVLARKQDASLEALTAEQLQEMLQNL